MLQSLYVKNLALIDEVRVEFGEGLNILTGETGAGKSIILGSVSLALGGRYTKDMIRQGAEYGFVELQFAVRRPGQVQALAALAIYPEDGMVALARRLMEGRSVSRINGETVNMAVLKRAAEILIDIHGQHEHQSLLHKKNHLGILDDYARGAIEGMKRKVAEAFRDYRDLKKQLAGADMDEAERERELSFLEFEIQEIRKADLKEGEDEELEGRFRLMENARKIAESAEAAYAFTSRDKNSVSENLSRAIRAFSDVAQYDSRAVGLYGQLVEVDSLLNDFNRELAGYRESLEFSEEEFREAETRLNEMNRLKKKYGGSIPGIMAYCEKQEEKAEKLRDYEGYLAGLKTEFGRLEKELSEAAGILTGSRKAQAAVLKEAVEDGLRDLNFEDVRFEISFAECAAYSEEGLDDVEFMISLNPGQPVRPLANVASGGELSRIMLAIKTVMADRDAVETLIFDEIDVGISGRTAQKVSEKMALIGKKRQVICITHLAQIAAMADQHYLIAKTVGELDTTTHIRLLDGKEEVEELARILGGAEITEAVLLNAKEMKELAGRLK